jgi:hypothetical protein
MKADKHIAEYRALRERPVWKLLASRNGPAVIGLLQTHLLDSEQRLSSSVFHERIARDLEELRGQGEDLPQSAQAYVAEWLREGYLERRLPPGAAEEEYELTTAALNAIRFVAGVAEPRASATESRLAVVIQQLVKLAEETNPNPERRAASLVGERDRLDREIAAIREGRIQPIDDAPALERFREIVALADGLAADFRRVRDEFERLNRELRERLLDDDGSRGEVLDRLFAGVDVISESEAGRTFSAFWRLLTDPEQSAALEYAVDEVLSRTFAGQLETKERRFLLGLTRTLLAQGGIVHEALRNFAGSLKSFVQSREYLEQRRIHLLLQEAQRAAHAAKDDAPAAGAIAYALPLTSSRLSSVSQWALYDPSKEAMPAGMADAGAPAIDLETVAAYVAQSEIDFRSLRVAIRETLRDCAQASIADVLDRFPAPQGLGSIVGYLALGSRHGVNAGSRETVSWEGRDGARRLARIPAIYFLRERANELG